MMLAQMLRMRELTASRGLMRSLHWSYARMQMILQCHCLNWSGRGWPQWGLRRRLRSLQRHQRVKQMMLLQMLRMRELWSRGLKRSLHWNYARMQKLHWRGEKTIVEHVEAS
jgi:hypothetical protein